jgi:threonine dehydrogenase-like Zn-dependent dehydrogenase
MTKLDSYKAATLPIPRRMLKWKLYGEGLDNLQVEEVDVPPFGPDELLVRQDACGLCFSDTKVIALGENHPRMQGRDLKTDPATLGHEVACTVVGVGGNLKARFKSGDRFIIQADVFYKGVSMAYGYVISGGLAEYSVIPKAMIDGDEGCYLLPIRDEDGYAEAALVEPWACVVSAYNQSHRPGIKPEGFLLVIAGEGAEHGDWYGAMPEGEDLPAAVVVVGAPDMTTCPFANEIRATGNLVQSDRVEDWAALRSDHTGDAGFDDIVILGVVEPEVVEGAARALANHGIVNFVGPHVFPRKLTLDIGRIHYNWHQYVGTTTWRVADAYVESRGADLAQGGIAWFIGAGGPMGQMHVQRAVQHPRPPRRILATDIDAGRLQSVTDRFGDDAQARGVELVILNPKEMSPEAFDAELNRLSEGRGFDDIVSLVPVPALIEHAAGFLAEGAWFNIFAGVSRGTMANLDVNAVKARRVRYVGSSGSAISDMRETLEKVESRELSTNASLAAIGGMRAAREGLAAVKDGRFPGKSLIFPLIPDLQLTSLSELQSACPTVYAKLKDGKFWTKEAEEELLRLTVGKE